MNKSRILTAIFFLLMVFLFSSVVCGKDEEESYSKRFGRWFNEVAPIITDKERSVFEKLKTIDERENFIEIFWKRRDPSPTTRENEFREEYEKRIAYVNENFSCILPGYLTDRGKVYLLLGKPHLIFSYPMGITKNSPFRHVDIPKGIPVEIWQYRYVPGYGVGVNFLFMAKNGGCNYELIDSPSELDALFGTFNQQKIRENGDMWDFKDEFASYEDVRKAFLERASDKVMVRSIKNVERLDEKNFYFFYFNLLGDGGKNFSYVYLRKIGKFKFDDYFGVFEDLMGNFVKDFDLNLENDQFLGRFFLPRGVYLFKLFCRKNERFFLFSKRIEVKGGDSGTFILLKEVSRKNLKDFSIRQDGIFMAPTFSIVDKDEKILFYFQARGRFFSPIYEIFSSRGKLLFRYEDKDNKTLLKRGGDYTSFLTEFKIANLSRGFYKLVIHLKGEKGEISFGKFFYKG